MGSNELFRCRRSSKICAAFLSLAHRTIAPWPWDAIGFIFTLCLPWHPQSHRFDSAPVIQPNIPRIPRSYQLSSPPFRAVAWAVPLLAHWKSPAAVCTGKTGIGRIALTWLVGVHSFTISEAADGLLIQPRLSFFQHADLVWVICSAMDSLAGDLGAMAPLANWIKLKGERILQLSIQYYTILYPCTCPMRPAKLTNYSSWLQFH